jgi:N-acetylmuramoyl-L-alanine amidase
MRPCAKKSDTLPILKLQAKAAIGLTIVYHYLIPSSSCSFLGGQMPLRRRALLLEAAAAVSSPFIAVRGDARCRQPRRPQRHYTSKPIVMVDSGHGGKDPGCIGVHGIEEKTIVLCPRIAARTGVTRIGPARHSVSTTVSSGPSRPAGTSSDHAICGQRVCHDSINCRSAWDSPICSRTNGRRRSNMR